MLRFKEVFFFTRNVDFPITYIKIRFTAVSTTWNKGNEQNIFPITSEYTDESYEATNNQTIQLWDGFDFVGSENPETGSTSTIAYSLYKVTLLKREFENEIPLPVYFYMDYRDTRIPEYRTNSWHGLDIYIKYDGQSNTVKITPRNDLIGNGEDGDHWRTIQNGDYIPIWEIQQQGTPSTNGFQDYWTNCETVIQSKNTDQFFVPNVIWGPIPNFSATGYKVYRAITPRDNPPPQTFSLIASVPSTINHFLDETLLANGSMVAHYKIRAYNNTTESDFSNITDISVSGLYKRGILRKDGGENPSLIVRQNYPNPFNPVTVISYSITQAGRVRIDIYNSIGQKLIVLSDSYKNEGTHSITFDATDLPSGIYYYAVLSDRQHIVGKMLLIR